jgi:glycosyltransferase involved in cell wall biosynthesis
MIINYALQTYDRSSNSCFDRYCTNNKKELFHKCVSSFFNSIKNAASENLGIQHNIHVVDNGSTEETLDLIERAIKKFNSENVNIELKKLNSGSMIESIKYCFEWLKETEGDLVYLVQDDYLYVEDGIYQMIEVFLDFYAETNHLPLIYCFNTPAHWKEQYKLRSTPRLIYPGKKQYWMQNYDISCTFMTHREQLRKNWHWIEYFMSIDQVNGLHNKGDLENISLNKILVDEKVLGLMPFESVGLHMQGNREKEPYIDWVKRWDSIELI